MSRRNGEGAVPPGLFRPPAATIVGFSESSAPSRTLLANLRRADCQFDGPIHLVNPARAARERSPIGIVQVWSMAGGATTPGYPARRAAASS